MSIMTKKTGLLILSAMLVNTTALAGNAHTPSLPSIVPSNPNAGECYARVKVPARFETQTQSVLVQEGYTEFTVEQPYISSRAEDVMVKEPSVEYRVRQPRYSTVTEQMVVRPAYEKLEVSPPEFQTVAETVQVSSSRLVWKKGNPAQLRSQGYVIHSTADAGPGGQGYSSTTQYGSSRVEGELCGSTCEIWCLVEEPGQSVTYNRKVLAKPSMVHRVAVDAKYQSITKQVLVDPGGVEEIPIPAEYQTVMVQDVMPARATGAHEVPPMYNDVAVNVPVEDERWEWRRVVCETGTYLEPDVSAPVYSQPSTYHSSSSYSDYSGHQSTTYTSGYHGSSHSTIDAYEGVCREDQKAEECYGQDVIEAYLRSEQNTGGTVNSKYDHVDSADYSYDMGPGYDYDSSTGYYGNVGETLEDDVTRRRSPRYRR